MLKSHMAPVIYIHVSAEDNKIFSMSTDNTIKVFTLSHFGCIVQQFQIENVFVWCFLSPLCSSRGLCISRYSNGSYICGFALEKEDMWAIKG